MPKPRKTATDVINENLTKLGIIERDRINKIVKAAVQDFIYLKFGKPFSWERTHYDLTVPDLEELIKKTIEKAGLK